MSPRRSVALVGMMGAGKTSVGRALAARIGWPFADSDAEVERAAGCTIAEIFAREGEAAFRERERRAVGELLSKEPLVLATGGGAFADPGSRSLLLERALTVWLDASPAVLARRLAGSVNRPLLAGGDRIDQLERLLETRRPCYQLAHLRLPADADDAAALAAQLDAIVRGPARG